MPAVDTMDLAEYARHDALGLAELVARKQVSPRELAATAAKAIAKVNPAVNAVVETYAARVEKLDEARLGNGPFRGVPYLIKDTFGHEEGTLIEFGSRLCKGMTVPTDTYYIGLIRAAGINVIGRSNAPEYSMSGTTEGALHGNCSNPWRKGFSAGGSTGGGAAAVVAGMVPIAHGTDIAGSIRIPASWCGGVGLKPSRGRVSFGPTIDENGFGLAGTFVQSKSVRDTAVMLDCLAVPQPGDPFVIPRPEEPYSALFRKTARPLRIGWSVDPIMGVVTDREVAAAVEKAARVLAGMGHHVENAGPSSPGPELMSRMTDIWFFGFDARLDGYAERTGRKPGPDTLEPVIQKIYAHARSITPARFMAAMLALNVARRQMGAFFSKYDLWLSPTTARVAEPWGHYNLGRTDVGVDDMVEKIYRVPCQFTLPHNVMGTPAISLPLAMHSSGLPIGVQLGARPAQEHVLLQLAAAFEEAMPWSDRVPPLHASCAPSPLVEEGRGGG